MRVSTIVQDACFNCGLIDEADKEIPEEYEYTALKYLVTTVNAINDDPNTELAIWSKTVDCGNSKEVVLSVPRLHAPYIGMSLSYEDIDCENGTLVSDRNFDLYEKTEDGWELKAANSIPGIVRISKILDEQGNEIVYVPVESFLNKGYSDLQNIWTVQETSDSILLQFSKPGKYIIYFGLPLIITHDADGNPIELQAKPSWQSYITNILAYRLASHYGLASKEDMKILADQDLNVVNMHTKNRHVGVDVAARIGHTLRNRSRIRVR